MNFENSKNFIAQSSPKIDFRSHSLIINLRDLTSWNVTSSITCSLPLEHDTVKAEFDRDFDYKVKAYVEPWNALKRIIISYNLFIHNTWLSMDFSINKQMIRRLSLLKNCLRFTSLISIQLNYGQGY